MKYICILFLLLATTVYGAATVPFPDYVTNAPSGASAIASTDLTPIIQGGVTKKVTIGQLIGLYIADGTDGTKGLSLMHNDSACAVATGYDGVVCIIGTGLYYKQGSVTAAVLLSTQKFTQCITIKDPVAESDYHAYRAGVAITVTNLHCSSLGGTSVTGGFFECNSNGASCAAIDASTNMTCTASTNVDDSGTLNATQATVEAGNYIKWVTASVDGAATELVGCFDYTMP